MNGLFKYFSQEDTVHLENPILTEVITPERTRSTEASSTPRTSQGGKRKSLSTSEEIQIFREEYLQFLNQKEILREENRERRHKEKIQILKDLLSVNNN